MDRKRLGSCKPRMFQVFTGSWEKEVSSSSRRSSLLKLDEMAVSPGHCEYLELPGFTTSQPFPRRFYIFGFPFIGLVILVRGLNSYNFRVLMKNKDVLPKQHASKRFWILYYTSRHFGIFGRKSLKEFCFLIFSAIRKPPISGSSGTDLGTNWRQFAFSICPENVGKIVEGRSFLKKLSKRPVSP